MTDISDWAQVQIGMESGVNARWMGKVTMLMK
jgi:hypothetical protein